MVVVLEGGCCVVEAREGPPVRAGTLMAWHQVGRAIGAEAISLRILEFAPGLSPGIRNNACDEVFYVFQGSEDCERRSTVFIDEWSYEIQPETGIYLRPTETLTINNPGPEPLVLISSQCPEALPASEFVPALMAPLSQAAAPQPPPVVRLADRRAISTSDRWYRVLLDDEVGSTQVTQFVGSIPPGRAPDHFHNYEEVLFILRGKGRMWSGKTYAPIAPGSCIYLPKAQIHCVENTAEDELRLLGVFYPAGSPAVRYEVG